MLDLRDTLVAIAVSECETCIEVYFINVDFVCMPFDFGGLSSFRVENSL